VFLGGEFPAQAGLAQEFRVTADYPSCLAVRTLGSSLRENLRANLHHLKADALALAFLALFHRHFLLTSLTLALQASPHSCKGQRKLSPVIEIFKAHLELMIYVLHLGTLQLLCG
jgi:hypothetical protein